MRMMTKNGHRIMFRWFVALLLLTGCHSTRAPDGFIYRETFPDAHIHVHAVFRGNHTTATEPMVVVFVPIGSGLSVTHGGTSKQLSGGTDLEFNTDGLFVAGQKKNHPTPGGMVFVARDDGTLVRILLSQEELLQVQWSNIKRLPKSTVWRSKIQPEIAKCVESRKSPWE